MLLRKAKKWCSSLNIRIPDSIPIICNVKGKYFEMIDIPSKVVTRGGLEPPMRESKSLVLPLHYRVLLTYRQFTTVNNQEDFSPASP